MANIQRKALFYQFQNQDKKEAQRLPHIIITTAKKGIDHITIFALKPAF
jgi:hypothetical protein